MTSTTNETPENKPPTYEALENETPENETLAFDVVIVGAGPAGLSAAIALKQLARAEGQNLEVCIIDKAAEIGGHSLSGALIETTALDELLPDWRDDADLCALMTTCQQDTLHHLSAQKSRQIPALLLPASLRHSAKQPAQIISLSQFCRHLGQVAEDLEVAVLPGFAAGTLLFNADKTAIIGVQTVPMGLDKTGQPKSSYLPGMNLLGKQTLFAEGCRGHLGKQLITHFSLASKTAPAHYALGVKEVWEIPNNSESNRSKNPDNSEQNPSEQNPSEQWQAGRVTHTIGWPLSEHAANGGGFCYEYGARRVSVGIVVDLDYANPRLSPFHELQQLKTHPLIAQKLRGGKRIEYGARTLYKGGIQGQAQMVFAGGLLMGDDAGTLNGAKLKGVHSAMKSGMLAAETILSPLLANNTQGISPETPLEIPLDNHKIAEDFQTRYHASWLYRELWQTRNLIPAISRWGFFLGGTYSFIEQQLCRGKLPWTLGKPTADHLATQTLDKTSPINYPKADGMLSFDIVSSLPYASIDHDHDQPCHLQLMDAERAIAENLPRFGEPAQFYCPANVYEIINLDSDPRLQINAQNCVHCKTCDIKDPLDNITWTAPQGGSGPNYREM